MEPSWLTVFPAATPNDVRAASIPVVRRLQAARRPSPNESLRMASWVLCALRSGIAHSAGIELSAVLMTAVAARAVLFAWQRADPDKPAARFGDTPASRGSDLIPVIEGPADVAKASRQPARSCFALCR
jgi:hypothetical protein